MCTLTNCTNNSNIVKHLDAVKPGTTPNIFAVDFISKDARYEYGSVFNSEGNEFYFAVSENDNAYILGTQYQNGKWSTPEVIIQNDKYSFNDPFLSPGDDRLYYISDKPKNHLDTLLDYDIWYSEKEEGKWSEPINAGPPINTDANEYYISFTKNGTMYFSSNRDNMPKRSHDFDIYRSDLIDGKFQTPVKLDSNINTNFYEADVFIDPNEEYIIFCSFRREGLGEGDLYISFKDENGHWQKAINLASPINTKGHELCPYVSSDGDYFFYTSQEDIKWVSTQIFDQLPK